MGNKPCQWHQGGERGQMRKNFRCALAFSISANPFHLEFFLYVLSQRFWIPRQLFSLLLFFLLWKLKFFHSLLNSVQCNERGSIAQMKQFFYSFSTLFFTSCDTLFVMLAGTGNILTWTRAVFERERITILIYENDLFPLIKLWSENLWSDDDANRNSVRVVVELEEWRRKEEKLIIERQKD